MFEEDIINIEVKLNRKLNRDGALHNVDTANYLYGHPLLNIQNQIEIYIFDYGVVLLSQNYKGSTYEQVVTVEKNIF